MSDTIPSFSLTRKEIPVVLDDKTYKLVELSGKARDEYMSEVTSRIKLGPNGKPQGLRDMTGLQGKLISLSLLDPSGKRVPREEVDEWPASVTDWLYKKAQDISALTEAVTEEVGKE